MRIHTRVDTAINPTIAAADGAASCQVHCDCRIKVQVSVHSDGMCIVFAYRLGRARRAADER
jgi:hypothetical protein